MSGYLGHVRRLRILGVVVVALAITATGVLAGTSFLSQISPANAVPASVDVAYRELEFPISRSSVESGNPLVAGGQRRYTNVITVGSTVVDAVVTTVSPANFTITDYVERVVRVHSTS